MEINLQNQYEKVLLLVFGLVALIVSGLLLFKSMAADEGGTNSFSEGSSTDSVGIEKVDRASKLLGEGSTWEQPLKEEKPVYLSISTPILKKGEEVFDMQDRETAPLWPPVYNWWWYTHKIDPTVETCLTDDEDSDGFPNVSEFLNQTDPQDANSTPDWNKAIHMVERVEIPYSFKLTFIDPEVQFTRGNPPGRRVWFLRAGTKDDTTGDKRFKILRVLPPGDDPFKDPARVELIDNFRDDGNPLLLAAGREEYVRPEYQAKLAFDITNETVQVKEGETFKFEGIPDLTLKDITAEEATISYEEDGAKKEFRAKLQQ